MLCGLFFATRKLHELFQKNFIEYTYSTFFFSRISEDVKALEKIENLWRDALTAAVDNHAKMTSVKENTDTESSGGVKYSKAEKNALTKEEYKRATAAFMNGDTSAIIEDCAIRVTNKNDVYKIKIVCYNLSDDGFDFQITEVYQIEKYSLQGTTQGRYLTGGVPPVRFSM